MAHAVNLPEVNATLTDVSGGGSSEDYDQATGADTSSWSGTLGAYLVEKVITRADGDGLNHFKQTYLIVPYGSVPVAIDDTVSYIGPNGVATARDVRQIEPHPVAGTTRLYLRDV